MRNSCVFAIVAASAFAQNPAPPAFEVASVKISPQSDAPRMAIETPGNTLNMRFVTLRVIVAWAYNTQRPQIDGPSWIDTARFDIIAKAAGPANEDEMRAMLQPVLAERFKLKFHRETRQMQVMALTVPKGGHKMTPSTHTGPVKPRQDPVRGTVIEGVPLSELAENMSHDMQVPIVDMTGLTGRFDSSFNVPKYIEALRSRLTPGERPPAESELRLVLMQDLMAGELGLRADSCKAPVEVLVIDHAEQKPVEN